MNKTIEGLWQQAIVESGKARPFEATWHQVKDRFAELLIKRCADAGSSAAYCGGELRRVREDILALGEPDDL